MKRAGRFKRKSRLRPRSPKRAAQIAEFGPIREAFKQEFAKCMACQKKPPTDCHEMVGGGARQKTYEKRELWLALCRDCHVAIQGLPQGQKHVTELAIKAVRDPEWYSLKAFREAKGGGVVVEQAEVDEVVRERREGK